MTYTNKNYYEAIDSFAPFATAEDWDNTGLLVGSPDTEVTAVVVALDLSSEVLDEAKKLGANLVVTHHPVIYPSLKRIGGENLLHRAIRKGVSVISAHTNYDRAENGVNDVLAAALRLKNIRALESVELPALGRLGELETPMSPDKLAVFVKDRLNVNFVKYTLGAPITTVAVCGGSCAELWESAFKCGAQALVTSEAKHHLLLAAREVGFTLIDAGHFSTEVVAMTPLAERLSLALPNTRVVASQTLRDPACYA